MAKVVPVLVAAVVMTSVIAIELCLAETAPTPAETAGLRLERRQGDATTAGWGGCEVEGMPGLVTLSLLAGLCFTRATGLGLTA